VENTIVDAAGVFVVRCCQVAVTATDSAAAVGKPSVAVAPSSSSSVVVVAADRAVVVVVVADKASAAVLLNCC